MASRAHPHVSDHALVRYIQRCYGLDVDAIRTEILPAEESDAVARLGDGTYPVHTATGGHRVVVRDGCVVTVLESNW